jgi:hypothetical protein
VFTVVGMYLIDTAGRKKLMAVGSGLIQGSGNALTPQANASRAQIATILMRFAQSIAK